MGAFSKNKQKTPQQLLGDSPEKILSRRRAMENQVGNSQSAGEDKHELLTGMAAEKPKGALCYLPTSIHRKAAMYAEDHGMTTKRFFFETLLSGCEKQGIITAEELQEALELSPQYGWTSRSK